MAKETDFKVEELTNAKEQHDKDISKLDNRLVALEEKKEKCYSSEKYEYFQDAVRKITLETIDGQGREKIKIQAKEAAKEYAQENGWAKFTFWIPTIISILAVGVAVWTLFIKKP